MKRRVIAFVVVILTSLTSLATVLAPPAHARKPGPGDGVRQGRRPFPGPGPRPGQPGPSPSGPAKETLYDGLVVGCPKPDGTGGEAPAFGDANTVPAFAGTATVHYGYQVSYQGEDHAVPEASAPLAAMALGKDVDFDGDKVPDFTIKATPRTTGSSSRLDALLSENFGLPNDAGLTHAMAGLDFVVTRKALAPSTTVPIGGGGTGGGALDQAGDAVGVGGTPVDGGGEVVPATSGSKDFQGGRFFLSLDVPATSHSKPVTERLALSVSSFGDNTQKQTFPATARTTVALKPSADAGDQGYLLFDTDTTPKDNATTPQLIQTIDLGEVGSGGQVTPSSESNLVASWGRAPKSFAAGFHADCDPAAKHSQMGWNQLAGVASNGSSPDLTIGVTSGPGQGREGKSDVALGVSLLGLPKRTDLLFEPRQVTLSHSTESDMAIPYFKVVSADAQGEPLQLGAATGNLPPRTVVTATSIAHAVTFCPAAPGPDPSKPCGGAPTVAAPRVSIEFENFLDGDPRAKDLPKVPSAATTTSYVVLGTADVTDTCPAQSQCPKPVSRFAAQVTKLRSAGVTKPTVDGFDVAGDFAAAQTARVLLDLDTRTDKTNEVASRGSLLHVDATVTQLPAGTTHLAFASSDARPMSAHGSMGGVVSGIDGSMHSVGPGPDAVDLQQHIVLGDPKSTSSPLPTSFDITWDASKSGPAAAPVERNKIRYSAPTTLRALLDATLTDRELRQHSMATRLWTKTTIPTSATVGWTAATRNGESGVDSVDVTGCGSNTTCDNDIDAVVTRVPRICPKTPQGTVLACISTEQRDGAGRPFLPPTSAASSHPPFTHWTPNEEGVQAVLDGARWSVRARVRDVRSVSYRPAPQTLCVSSVPTGDRFLVDLLKGGDKGDSLYTDGILTRLPADLGIRIADAAGNEGTPWLSTSSTGCTALDAPAGEQAQLQDPPHLDAMIRYADRPEPLMAIAAPGSETKDGPATPRPLLTPGIEARALIGSSLLGKPGDSVGVHAHVHELVPSQLRIWKPVSSRCDEHVAELIAETCQPFKSFEPDRWNEVKLRYESSLATLGPLDAVVRQLDTTPGKPVVDTRYAIGVHDVPGSLRGTVRITQNARFPQQLVDATLDSGAVIGQVALGVFDDRPGHQAHYGEPGDAAYSADVPAYSGVFRNVPKHFVLNGRLHLGVEQDKTVSDAMKVSPDPQATACKDIGYTMPARQTSLAYVHADVDLANTVEHMLLTVNDHAGDDAFGTDKNKVVDIEGRRGPKDEAAAFGPVRLNARINDAHLDKAVDKTHAYIPDNRLGGFPTGWATTEFGACLDLDIPVFMSVSNRSRVRIGDSMAALAAGELKGERQADPGNATKWEVREHNLWGAVRNGDGTYDPLRTVSEGAYFRRHYVRLHPATSDKAEITEDDYVVDKKDRREDIRVMDAWPLRLAQDDAYWTDDAAARPLNEGRPPAHGYADKNKTFEWTEAFLDVLWDRDARNRLHNRDASATTPFRPGSAIYQLALQGETPDKEDPNYHPQGMPPALNLNEPGIPVSSKVQEGVADINLKHDCQPRKFMPLGVGADGTTYRLLASCWKISGPDEVRPFLQAVWPNGRQRWLTKIGPSELLKCRQNAGGCYLHVHLTPDRLTGAVDVTVGWHATSPDYIDVRNQRFDASGIPGQVFSSSLAAADPAVTPVDGGRTVTLTCDAPGASCGPDGPGAVRYWVFGDGQVEIDPAKAKAHTYAMPGTYLAFMVQRGVDSQGHSIEREETFRVTVQDQALPRFPKHLF